LHPHETRTISSTLVSNLNVLPGISEAARGGVALYHMLGGVRVDVLVDVPLARTQVHDTREVPADVRHPVCKTGGVRTQQLQFQTVPGLMMQKENV